MDAKPDSPTTMRWPSIQHELFRDFYIMIANDPWKMRAEATLAPGQTRPILYPDRVNPKITGDKIDYSMRDTGYRVTYKDFHMTGNPGTPGTQMVARMVVTAPDGREAEIEPGKQFTEDRQMENKVAQIPSMNGAAELDGGIDPATKQVTANFEFPNFAPLWLAPVAVTNKPLIWLVWLGVILMGLGALCAMTRRALEARKQTLFSNVAAEGVGDAPVPVTVASAAAASVPPSAGGKTARHKRRRSGDTTPT